MSDKPVVLISSANDAQSTGWAASNGGCKLYSLWAKLLRQHNFEAYVVTYDGAGAEWLIDMPPFLSIAEAAALKASGREIRWMTGWLWSKAYLDLVGDGELYFFDAELAFTSGAQRGLLEQWLPRMKKIATHSRTQQAYYMATYGITPMFVPEWSDIEFWKPYPNNRRYMRVGWMDEGKESQSDIEIIRQRCEALQVTPEFVQIGGSEARVLEGMQSCDVFLGLGRGKHPLYGEGCNRSAQEAQHAGCVVVMYDTHGCREYILEGYTGYLAPIGNAEQMGDRVAQLLRDEPLRAQIRQHSIDFAMNYFAPEKRWNAVADFLDLETERV